MAYPRRPTTPFALTLIEVETLKACLLAAANVSQTDLSIWPSSSHAEAAAKLSVRLVHAGRRLGAS